VFDYLIQEIFQFCGLNAVAGLASFFLWVVIFALGIWAYSRYSGQLRDVGVAIDETTNWIWTNVLAPLTQEGVQHVVRIGHRLATDPANVTSQRTARNATSADSSNSVLSSKSQKNASKKRN